MTAELERTLSDVRAKIHRARVSLVSDEKRFLEYDDCVRTQLVSPILNALGWETDSADEVQLDYSVGGEHQGSTLAVFVHGTPGLLIQMRGLGEDFDEEYALVNLLPRAGENGFEWVLLTDGDHYDLYNSHSGLSPEHRAFDAVQLSVDPPEDALELFELLSKQCIAENSIEAEWRCRVVDRQVGELLEGLVAPDSTLVQVLLRESKNLSAADIRGSLARANMSLEFAHCPCAVADSVAEADHELSRANGMSDAELRIATWLQRRSIERWAKESALPGMSRAAQRRVVEKRRSVGDRRSARHDRRVARVERAQERRTQKERRCNDRRANAERRVIPERRRARRHA